MYDSLKILGLGLGASEREVKTSLPKACVNISSRQVGTLSSHHRDNTPRDHCPLPATQQRSKLPTIATIGTPPYTEDALPSKKILLNPQETARN
jgi:hypothetical protein